MRLGLGQFHPLVSFVYYAGAVMVLFLFPFLEMMWISLCAVLLVHFLQGSWNGKFRLVRFYLWMSALVFLLNPLFSDRDGQLFFVTWWGKVVTWEALHYGVISALSLFTMLMWFLSAQSVLRTHQLLYLFSQLTPRGAMLITMAMRNFRIFTNRFQQFASVHSVSTQLSWNQRIQQKARFAMKFVFATLTWALEDGVHIADSMKARGYGSTSRSQYHPYRFARRDAILLGFILGICAVLVWIWLMWVRPFGDGTSLFQLQDSLFTWMGFASVSIYWILPVAVLGKEIMVWQSLNS